MTTPERHPCPVADTLRHNIGRIRDGLRLTRADLSDRTADSGRRLPLIAVRRIETGTRQVDVDDLLALAVALDVAPVDLLVPAGVAEDAPWFATPGVSMPAGVARGWIGGTALRRQPSTAAELAEMIRWMPDDRAREVAKAWSAQGR